MKSLVVKRSITTSGHRTSVSIEDAFWSGVKEIAAAHGMTVSQLLTVIDDGRQHENLSSAIRLFVLDYYQQRRG